jgi:hypothetical protein
LEGGGALCFVFRCDPFVHSAAFGRRSVHPSDERRTRKGIVVTSKG